MRPVALVAGGLCNWGRRAATWKELVQEAGKALFDDAPELDKADVDSFFIGAAEPERFAFQSHVAPLAAEQLGVEPWRVLQRTELACASGQSAIRSAWLSIAQGLSDLAVVLGVEKMNVPDMAEGQSSMACVLDREWDGVHGANAPPYFAMVAQRHMHEHGTTREDLTAVRVQMGKYAATNPTAHFPKAFSAEDVEGSVMIAPPLRLLDCSGITDGAAAVVMTTADRARDFTDAPLYVHGSGQGSKGHNVANMGPLTEWPQLGRACRDALDMAGIGLGDLDVAEVHDCFSISPIMVVEEMGLVPKGDGGAFFRDGQADLGGDLPLNTRGGLLGCGHPLGATGVAQAVELLWQRQGRVPDARQVDQVDWALSHNLSGSANAHSVLVYGAEPPAGTGQGVAA